MHRALEGSSYLKTVEIFSEFKELSLSLGDVHTADWSLPSQMSSRCLASKRFLSANQGSVKGGSVLHITFIRLSLNPNYKANFIKQKLDFLIFSYLIPRVNIFNFPSALLNGNVTIIYIYIAN